ncbi:hypothetical protein B7P43_G06603, partial [Cryptotermes secundus]
MASVKSVESNGAKKKVGNFRDNVNLTCLCCVELRDELQRVRCELKSVMEIMKVLKEDQEQFSCRVDSVIPKPANKINSTSTTSCDAFYSSDWNIVPHGKSHPKIDTITPQQFKIPIVVNRYVMAENIDDDILAPSFCNIERKPKVKHVKSNVRRASKKIMIIGDSHIRGCAANLLHMSDESFEVMGKVMPGAGLLNITQAAYKEISEMNFKDSVVICGGSNDINKNEATKGLKLITNFVLQHQYTNIILVPALHRHDLEKSSCINREIQTFNRKLRKLTKFMSHVKLLDIALNREDFTRHGM